MNVSFSRCRCRCRSIVFEEFFANFHWDFIVIITDTSTLLPVKIDLKSQITLHQIQLQDLQKEKLRVRVVNKLSFPTEVIFLLWILLRFSDTFQVVLSTDDRHELYVTLESGIFDGKSIEVRIYIVVEEYFIIFFRNWNLEGDCRGRSRWWRKNQGEIFPWIFHEFSTNFQDVITYAGNTRPPNLEFRSCVYYHSSTPSFNEIVRIVIPAELWNNSHLKFEIREVHSGEFHFNNFLRFFIY